jgi:hypothetical protein
MRVLGRYRATQRLSYKVRGVGVTRRSGIYQDKPAVVLIDVSTWLELPVPKIRFILHLKLAMPLNPTERTAHADAVQMLQQESISSFLPRL